MANPGSAAEVEKFLKGVNFPASKDDLVKKARSSGAPEDVIDLLESLSDKKFNSPIDVMKSFGQGY